MLEAVAVIATSEGRTEPQPLSDAVTAAATAPPGLSDRLCELFKVRVTTMVLITSAAGFYLGSLRSGISPFNAGMVKALAGIAVVTCGASALNQAHGTQNGPVEACAREPPDGDRSHRPRARLIVGFLAVFLGSLYSGPRPPTCSPAR